LKSYELPAYNPVYPTGSNMVWTMGKQLPKFVNVIRKEQKETERLVRREKMDCVISDNRYGCYSQNVKSVFITHQIHLLMPARWMETGMNLLNRKLMHNFSECWIPANDDKLIPDLLLGREKLNTKFIGYLSRVKSIAAEKKNKVLVICSGPEPQRSIFEEVVSTQLKKVDLLSLVVRGIVGTNQETIHLGANVSVENYLHSEEMYKTISESEIVISRSGYSTIMDLMKLGKKAIFVPTPGQTEQEYLAKVLMEKGIAYSMSQEEFNLEKALKELGHYSGFKNSEWNSLLLKKAVQSI
jgi:uncharacterized protein (TIGR00661 family)